MDIEAAIQQLQDALIVTAEVQRRQAEVQKIQAEQIREDADASRKRFEHIEITLAEIGDKLNGLIGYIDGRQA